MPARASIIALLWLLATCMRTTPTPQNGSPQGASLPSAVPELECAAGELARAGSLPPRTDESLITARLDPGDLLTVRLQADHPQGLSLMLRSRRLTVVELAAAVVGGAEANQAVAPVLRHEATEPDSYRVLLAAGDEAVSYRACVRITRRAGRGSVADAGTLR